MAVYIDKLMPLSGGHFKLTCVPGAAAAPKGGRITGCANMTGC